MSRRRDLFAALFLALVLALGWFCVRAPRLLSVSTEPPWTLILDAGHGEPDGGAVASDGTCENDLNLDICNRAYALFRLFYITPLRTRVTLSGVWDHNCVTIREKKVSDLQNRVRLIERTPRAVLVSVHQNSFPGRARGAQIYYEGEESLPLAQSLCDVFGRRAELSLRPLHALPKGLYLFDNTACPTVLCETGYLSDPDDLALLKDENHRELLAFCILCGVLRSEF